MIVEPVPAESRSRRRRRLGRLLVVVPVLLLVAVVGAAVIGAGGQAPVPSPVVAARSTPAASPAADAGGQPGSWPQMVLGLPVRTVPQVLTDRAAGRSPVAGVPAGIVAIGGWLGAEDASTLCGDDAVAGGPATQPVDAAGPLCIRRVVLVASPWPSGAVLSVGAAGPHVHAFVPLGVRLPDDIATHTMAAGGAPIEVVAVGRFSDLADGCGANGIACDTGFQLDGIAWTPDGDLASRPVFGPGVAGAQADWLLSNERVAERLAVGDTGKAFVSVLLYAASLSRFDRRAAAAFEAHPSGLVWYVRGLAMPRGPTGAPAAAWAIVDDTTLEVLAGADVTGAGTRSPRVAEPRF